MVTARRSYTYADLFAWPEDGDDQIYDLLGGELVVRNAPDLNHGIALNEVTLFLGDAQRAGYGYFLSGPHAVALDYPLRGDAAQDVSHPDLLFIVAGREDLWRGKRAVEGVPDLVIEVRSPTTSADHIPGGKHHAAYERNGVPHYWVVDPRARVIEQYMLGGTPYVAGRYGEPTVLREGDTLRCPLFPDLTVPVATIFRNVVYREGEARRRRRAGVLGRVLRRRP